MPWQMTLVQRLLTMAHALSVHVFNGLTDVGRQTAARELPADIAETVQRLEMQLAVYGRQTENRLG